MIIQYARLIMRHAHKLSYEEYFHVKPFLDRVFQDKHLSNERLQLMREYNHQLERKRAGKPPIPEGQRFTRELSEVRQFALSGKMPL